MNSHTVEHYTPSVHTTNSTAITTRIPDGHSLRSDVNAAVHLTNFSEILSECPLPPGHSISHDICSVSNRFPSSSLPLANPEKARDSHEPGAVRIPTQGGGRPQFAAVNPSIGL